MTSDREGRHDQPWREGLEEGYWEALLSEEENAAEVTPEDLRDGEMAVGEDTEDWAGAQSYLDSGEPLELEVISFNRGGGAGQAWRAAGVRAHLPCGGTPTATERRRA